MDPWRFNTVHSNSQLWLSNGNDVHSIQQDASTRLIVDQGGFLDITTAGTRMLDANGLWLWDDDDKNTSSLLELNLWVYDSTFTLAIDKMRGGPSPTPGTNVSGLLKPLPRISADDAQFIDTMMDKKYIPYQQIPDAPGKTTEEIKDLGARLFPFSPYSFQLAMCIYDWTTASFTRMVFMKIFEYTGIPPIPFPTDQKSISEQIWASNWSYYTPQNSSFMNSFMMKPAWKPEDVRTQLETVGKDLQKLSDVENRVLSAAFKALPRTSIISKHRLFSGQVDIYQLGLDHFSIEFLECPLNDGPVGQELVFAFADVMASYVSTGHTITTKMVWSFTDSIEDAIHYANGIVLVAEPPSDSIVWESAAYVTPLSDDPNKTEYTFAPGTQFDVKSVDHASIEGNQVVVVTLEPKSRNIGQRGLNEIRGIATEINPIRLEAGEAVKLVEGISSVTELPHSKGKTGGRRCACYLHD